MNSYFLSGDKTGVTYGVYKGHMFDEYEMIKGGLTFAQARKLIADLQAQDIEENKKRG